MNYLKPAIPWIQPYSYVSYKQWTRNNQKWKFISKTTFAFWRLILKSSNGIDSFSFSKWVKESMCNLFSCNINGIIAQSKPFVMAVKLNKTSSDQMRKVLWIEHRTLNHYIFWLHKAFELYCIYIQNNRINCRCGYLVEHWSDF